MQDLAFVGGARDRSHDLRSKPEELARLLDGGWVLPLWQGQVLMGDSGPGWLPNGHPVLSGAGDMIFLGLNPAGAGGLFATDISHWRPEEGVPLPEGGPVGQPHPQAPDGWVFVDLRQHMARLGPEESEIAATARALVEWHRGHGFCPACGGRTEAGGGGWHRLCTDCGRQHFPRTDPCVIMLVTQGDKVLLGRSPGWPAGMFSLLAGFIEPGETIEAAVRREVHEETGVRCGKVRYLASQPWPFPASLMIGCVAEAETTDIHLDPVELEEAFWAGREEVAEIEAGRHPVIRPPRQGSIARFFMSNWLADRA